MEPTFLIYCLICLLVLIFITLSAYVLYSGLLTKIEVGAGPPPINLVKVAYKFGRGPYKDTGYYFTEITSLASKQRCLGIYYDDPKVVESNKLRWAVGCIVSEEDEPQNQELVNLLKSKGYSFITFPKVSNVVKCNFPYTTFLSCFIAIFRVYPMVGEYVQLNKLCAHPWLEIYDGPHIRFMAPLARQDEFYVPEANEEEESDSQEYNSTETQPSTSALIQDVNQPDEPAPEQEQSKEETSAEATNTKEEPEMALVGTEEKILNKSLEEAKETSDKTEAVKKQDAKEDIVDKELVLTTETVEKPVPQDSPTSSDQSAVTSESSLLTSGTDVSSCLSTTEASSLESTDASTSVLTEISSDSENGEPFEVIKKEDTQ